MFIKILIQYLLGYVTINIEGYFIERFVNICRSKSIFLWNIKRKNASVLRANIGIQEFRKIKPIAGKTKCLVKIESKKGVPFLFHRYRKRKIFFILLSAILVVLFISSHFVWNIEIKGNVDITAEELIKNVEENGLKIGTLKKKVDTKEVINQIRLKRSDLSWIGIHLIRYKCSSRGGRST